MDALPDFVWSDGGSTLCSIEVGGEIAVWDTNSGAELLALPDFERHPTALAFADGARELWSASARGVRAYGLELKNAAR